MPSTSTIRSLRVRDRLSLGSPRTVSTGESRSITLLLPLLGLLDGDEERVALLSTVVHHDVDSGVVLLQPVGAGPCQRPLGVVRAGDQRDHLAATTEQPAEDVA